MNAGIIHNLSRIYHQEAKKSVQTSQLPFLSKITLPNLETGVGSIESSSFESFHFKRKLYRIQPNLLKRLQEDYFSEKLERNTCLLRLIARTIIASANCVFTDLQVQKGFATTFMAFWQDLKENGLDKKYYAIKDVIADSFQNEEMNEEVTQVAILINPNSLIKGYSQAKILSEHLNKQIRKNADMISGFFKILERPSDGGGGLTIPNDPLEINKMRFRLLNPKTGFKCMIENHIRDNCPSLYNALQKIFSDIIKGESDAN